MFGPTLRCTADAKKLALTFDDGPNPAVTSRLLDLFDRYSARVTFFLVGKYARACPDLVREMAVRGHVLGNHTQTHPNLIFLFGERESGKSWCSASKRLPMRRGPIRRAGCASDGFRAA